MRRLFSLTLVPFTSLYTTFFPRSIGAKVVIRHGDELLLVRNIHGTRLWSFPGGGVEKDEPAHDAVRREVAEEVGLALGEVVPLGRLRSTPEYRRDAVQAFAAESPHKDIDIDPAEILEAGWFNEKELPENMTPMTRKILQAYKKHRG